MRKLLFLLSLALLAPTAAFAQSMSPVGTISHLWVAGGMNYGFRVFLNSSGADQLNGCNYDFAYLNTNHDNYQAVVATLLSSYNDGKTVTLHMSKDPNGFCTINEIEA